MSENQIENHDKKKPKLTEAQVAAMIRKIGDGDAANELRLQDQLVGNQVKRALAGLDKQENH